MRKVWLSCWLLLPGLAGAQEALQGDAPQTGTGAVLVEMASRAAVIFCGAVQGIVRHDDLGFVEVTFRVDQPVKGTAGATYVLREWSGRWAGQGERYTVGRNLLMLLAAPGSAGLSAPVDGEAGAIPIVPGAMAAQPGSTDTLSATVQAAPDTVVDLRQLQALAPRTVTPVPAAVALSETPWVGAVSPFQPSGSLVVNAALPIVLHLLRGGQ